MKEFMKLILGSSSLSHMIFFIANSASITRPENLDIFTMITACKYYFVNTAYISMCSVTHTHTHTIYNKWTISYLNPHTLCVQFEYSVRQGLKSRLPTEFLSINQPLIGCTGWASPTKNKCLQ